MGRPQARKKQHKGDKPMKERFRLKRKTKDLDEIHADLKNENVKQFLQQEIDHDKPGSAQFYCVHCAKHFINKRALEDHFKGRPHKRRIRLLSIEPYTQEEANRAAGMGSYVAAKKLHIDPRILPAAAVAATATAETSVETVTETSNMS